MTYFKSTETGTKTNMYGKACDINSDSNFFIHSYEIWVQLWMKSSQRFSSFILFSLHRSDLCVEFDTTVHYHGNNHNFTQNYLCMTLNKWQNDWKSFHLNSGVLMVTINKKGNSVSIALIKTFHFDCFLHNGRVFKIQSPFVFQRWMWLVYL